MRRLPDVRYIRPESIEEGDTVLIKWVTGDMTVTRSATVVTIMDYHFKTAYLTASGTILFERTTMTTTPPGIVVTLLNRPNNTPETVLEGLETP